VLIDNFKLGTLAKWGFTDAWFDEHAPRLVRCQVTGYGSTGRSRAARLRFILQAESGLMSICGTPDGVPTKYGVAIVDVCTGMLAVTRSWRRSTRATKAAAARSRGVALRVVARHAGQRGVVVSHAGRGGGRYGNGHPSIVPYTTYAVADGTIALAVGNDTQFAKCAAVLGASRMGE